MDNYDKEKLKQVIIDYGNAMFDCGEWDGDIKNEYVALHKIAKDKRNELFKLLNIE